MINVPGYSVGPYSHGDPRSISESFPLHMWIDRHALPSPSDIMFDPGVGTRSLP